jgi:hypothetical protein
VMHCSFGTFKIIIQAIFNSKQIKWWHTYKKQWKWYNLEPFYQLLIVYLQSIILKLKD